MGVLGLWTIIEKAGALQVDGADDGSAVPTRACSLLLAAQQLQHVQVQRAQHSAAASSAAATVAPAIPPSAPPPSPRSPRVLAVDLSVWLMEAHAISKGIQHAQQAGQSGASAASAAAGSGIGVPYAAPRKHYLAYLLTRVLSFLRNNIRLIFVTDGRAPVLKSRLTTKENQAGGGGDSSAGAGAVQAHRAKQNPLFAAQIRDCARLLQLMDLPVLELERGEAEALCAALNARGACDGVLTTDGDAFLFGARSVLRNLEASSTNLQATVVDINNIHAHTGLDRHKLILLALLLGSDYTSGVRSLGPHKAVELIRILDSCADGPLDAGAAPRSTSAVGDDHPTMRLFRAIMATESAEAAIQMLLARYPHADAHTDSPSSAAGAALHSSPPASSPGVDFTSMTLAELKLEMTRRGLKTQSKAAMSAKLQQIAALSTVLSLSQAADSDSSDESDADDAPVHRAGKVVARKKRSAHSKSLVRVRSFLRTYVSKVHARYHPNRAEMELVLQSYLQPTLHPPVETLEKKLHTRIPQANFLKLRSFLADECQLSFVKFERSWLPVELHLDLWRRQHALHTERMRLEAIAAFKNDEADDSDGDDDLIVLTPPNRSSSASVAAAAATGAAHSGSSRSISSAPSSGSSASTSAVAPAHYVPSHIAKRRVIQGAAYVVLIWNKTPLGYKEIATLPKQMQADVASVTQANAMNEDDEEEIDMTAAEPASSPVVAGSATSACALAASKRQPVQDVDMALYETYEPTWFAHESLPELVARFESEETAEAQRKVQAKEQAKADKVAARANKPVRSDSGATAKATAKPRGRPKKLVADPHTPSIAAFLSPVPTASKEADAVPVSAAAAATATAARKDAADFEFKQPSVIPAAVDGSHPAFLIPQSIALSKLASVAPNLFASLMRSTQSDATAASVSRASDGSAVSIHVTSTAAVARSSNGVVLKSQQSSLHSFVKASKITSNPRQPPPHKSLSKHGLAPVHAPPPSALPAAKNSPDADDADLSPSRPLGSRPPSPLLSSLLSTCPMCGSGFPSRLLESHVNACLDEQQQREDERMASELQRADRKPLQPSAAAKRMHDQLGDDHSLAGDAHAGASRSRRASSPSPPASSRSSSSSSHSLTPQKRKKHGSSRHGAVSPMEEIDVVSPEAAMPPRTRHAAPSTVSAFASAASVHPTAAALPSASTFTRTLIDLMDSDEDEGDEQLQQLIDEMSDDEDDQPGSLIYCRAAAAATKCAVSSAH